MALIATSLNSLQPTERRVAEAILQAPEDVVELTAQQLADRVGVGRSTVVRACQSFGYRGFPQLRVALATALGGSGEAPDYGEGVLGRMRAEIGRIAQSLPQAVSVLDETSMEWVVRGIANAGRVLIVANGLSAPIASDLSMRLTAIGRPAEFVPDAIAQQISASTLGADDMCLVVSGSGANEASLRAARQASGRSAKIVALTSFAVSALTTLADEAIVIAPAGQSFRDELEHTSRVAHAVFVEVFVGAVTHAIGENARLTREQVMGILSDNLDDGGSD
ncbi:MurR/RpiR family transcriptional regulator [Microbacterium sp. NPDC089698]|uniref:MurR/RpiR family transcriptional regulator n=1 Tax=Microbacterium sp. NPDC089698 TaxID=3364200 RepID=UPI00380E5B54